MGCIVAKDIGVWECSAFFSSLKSSWYCCWNISLPYPHSHPQSAKQKSSETDSSRQCLSLLRLSGTLSQAAKIAAWNWFVCTSELFIGFPATLHFHFWWFLFLSSEIMIRCKKFTPLHIFCYFPTFHFSLWSYVYLSWPIQVDQLVHDLTVKKEVELRLGARTGLCKCQFPSICGTIWNMQYLDVATRWCQESAHSCLHLPGLETKPKTNPVG